MGIYQSGQPIEISDTFTVSGVETNPGTIVYKILGPDGATTTYTWPGSPRITNPAIGHFLLSLDPPAIPGDYLYDVDATGAVVASRSGNFTVLADVTSQPDTAWAVLGPCSPWATADDVWNCCGQPMVTVGEGTMAESVCVDMTPFAAEANQILYELSGRLFAGRCEKTVRPCSTRNRCGWQVLSRGHLVDSWDTYWNGSYWWGNGRFCGCQPLDRVLLSGYPVREVSEVKIDGAVLASSNYRLDERRYLTRTDDQFWPRCQDLSKADTASGTFSVRYGYGQDPPYVGAAAAAQLGCELYKACTDQECALPSGVTTITRQGITISKSAFAAWAFDRIPRGGRPPGWYTGLSLVDAFLSAYAPTALRRRPAILSPDRPRYARSYGQ